MKTDKKIGNLNNTSDEMLWKELSRYKARRKKRQIVKNIVSPIGNIIFILCCAPLFFYALVKIGNTLLTDTAYYIFEKITFLDLTYMVEKYIELCNKDIYLVVISALAPFVVSFLITAVLTLLLMPIINPKPTQCPTQLLADSESALHACRSLVSVMPEMKYRGYFIAAIPVPLAILVLGLLLRRTELNSVLLTVATSAVIYIILTFSLWISSIFGSLLYRFGPSKRKLSADAQHILSSDYVSELMSKIASEPKKETGKLNIYYKSEYDGSNDVTVSVKIDGSKVGILSNGKNTFELENGIHSLEAEVCSKKTQKKMVVTADNFEINGNCHEIDLGLKE